MTAPHVALSGGSPAPPPDSPPSIPPSGVEATVLIVDDNAALTENLKDILEGSLEAGPTVITAASAGDATRIARARGFDVALVDVRLPDGSGVDLVRALRSASPLGEVILITGIATVDSAIAALQAGAFALLLKSFRPEELLSSVQQALAKVQLKRDRERLMLRQRALIDTAGVLIVGLDRDDCVALFNPKVAELTANGSPIQVGKHFLTHWTNDEGRERMAQALREVRRGGVSVEVEAGFVDGGRGPSRRIHWHLSAVDDPAGRDGLVYGIGLDVTERRALERRAAEAEALSAMGSLALGLAHEIRNPLNAAVLQLHLLGRAIERLDGDSAIKSSMRNRVTIVGSEIGRLERLLTEFLELARPRGVKLEPVDLPTLVDAVIALEQESLALRRVEIHREIEPCALAAGDVEKLKQVLINLVANARDALQEGGSLRVRVFGDDEPCFEVSDDGPGIDASVLENVFDPFFTTKEAGTGLGLAIVRKIVGQHAGSVDIDSTPGKGTRVIVKLQRWARPSQK